MKLDGGISTDIRHAARDARALEAGGYTGGFTAELKNDPFLSLGVAATVTERLEIGTSIAVAFARSPMTLAHTAHDLQRATNGRFILGLGSQIKPHITKRFSMPWSSPAARMRELVLAMHAIWARWNEGTPLDFRGDFYQHTLMTPMFDPGPTGFGRPRVFLAGVGQLMTRAAGEVADGFIAHGFTTPEYLRDHTMPAIQAGLALSGRLRQDFEVVLPLFSVTGDTEQEIARRTAATRQQIAFYGSTPAYEPVLAHHGWSEVHHELNRMSKKGLWVEMGDLIDDDILDAFAVVAPPEQIPAAIERRYGGLVDRLVFRAPMEGDEGLSTDAVERWRPILDALRAV